MTPELLFFIGTIATWVGWILALKAISSTVRWFVRQPGDRHEDLRRGMLLNGVAGALFLLVSFLLPKEVGREVAAGIHLPVTWVLMPYTAWIATAGVGMALYRAFQWIGALNATERKQRLIQIVAWLLAAVVGVFGYKNSDGTIQIFRGMIPLGLPTIVAFFLLAIVSMVVMGWASQRVSSRGAGKLIATHVALLAGSILFGIPFLWLLTSSVKEDKDIANSDALHWTPMRTVTVPYDDPDDPHYAIDYKGTACEANVLQQLPGNRVRLNVLKPLSIRSAVFDADVSTLKRVPKEAPLVTSTYQGKPVTAMVLKELDTGDRRLRITKPEALAGTIVDVAAKDAKDLREPGAKFSNYPEALDFLPADTQRGFVYLKNTLFLVFMSIVGTVVSCVMVAYAFSRMQFFGKNFLFTLMLSTMMLPGAVTMLPSFLIFRGLGWVDTLKPIWVPSFFAGAFNVFLLRQFFSTIPMELEDAAKIDGCSYLQTLSRVMAPQIKPAVAAISIWTAMGAWNNFMGPLIYISSPEKMPISYALQQFSSGHGLGEPGLLMAFTVMTIMPVVLLFFFAQRYFIEGVTLSGLGGR